LGSHSINTAPLATIEYYIRDEPSSPKLPISDIEIENYFNGLKRANINMEEVYDKLLEDGLKAFEEAFSDMLNRLDD
jgi:transaldolase